MSQKPSMSLFLNYASAFINVPANVVPLLFTVSQSGSWTSTWFLTTAQTINMVPASSRTTGPEKALRGNLDHRQHHGVRWQHRPLTSARSSLASCLQICLSAQHTYGSVSYLSHPSIMHLPTACCLPPATGGLSNSILIVKALALLFPHAPLLHGLTPRLDFIPKDS